MTFTAKDKDKDDQVNNFFPPYLTPFALCRFHVKEGGFTLMKTVSKKCVLLMRL